MLGAGNSLRKIIKSESNRMMYATHADKLGVVGDLRFNIPQNADLVQGMGLLNQVKIDLNSGYVE